MVLTRSFSADQFAWALESWDWADIEGKQPLFTSPAPGTATHDDATSPQIKPTG
jgi:hypothetical protein